MTRILFHLFHTASHYNASFKFAKHLAGNGHEVAYYVENGYRENLMMNGFRYIEIPDLYLPIVEPTRNRMKFYVGLSNAIKSYESNFLTGKFYDAAIEEFHPEIVFLDLTNVYFAPILISKNVPFIIISTKVCSDFDINIPPPTTGIVPLKNKFINKPFMMIVWTLFFLRRFWNNYFESLSPVKLSRLKLAFEYSNKAGIDLDQILLRNRAIHYGIRNRPEFFLIPFNFDLPYKLRTNQYVLSPCFYGERQEILTEQALTQLHRLEDVKRTKKIIYCSFGSCEILYQRIRIRFIEKLINICQNHNEYFIVISIGNNLDRNIFDTGANLILDNVMPQLKIISLSDLVITHGGMQTIEECIYFGKPILAYPLTAGSDQFGNSCRVVYHKIGLRGNVRRDSMKEILKKIHDVLSIEDYTSNIKRMKRDYIASNSFNENVKVANDLLKSSLVHAN